MQSQASELQELEARLAAAERKKAEVSLAEGSDRTGSMLTVLRAQLEAKGIKI